jgi:glycosyltransferase involved in cell wall biosynthesis
LVFRLRALRPERYRIVRPPSVLAHRAGHIWEQALLPTLGRRFGALLSPANAAPLASHNNVVGIFDAAAVRHPLWYGRTFAAWQRFLLPRLAARAQVLLTASEFGRAELIDVLGASPDRVAVVPLGVDSRFRPDADSSAVAQALGSERPYVLAVGSLLARKNLTALDETARRLGEQGIDLLVAGGQRGYMRGEAIVPGRQLGYVPDRLLPGLLAGALVVVLPSRYEGFGLPCLEAMASGTPVVASNATALPEVCGDAAWLVDPDDREGFAEATVTAATSDSTRRRLRERGLARAAGFTWSRTAEGVDGVMDRVLAGG